MCFAGLAVTSEGAGSGPSVNFTKYYDTNAIQERRLRYSMKGRGNSNSSAYKTNRAQTDRMYMSERVHID